VHFGEDIETAVQRECKEELNLDLKEFQLVNKRLFKAKTSTALMFIFASITDDIPNGNTDELEEIAYFKIEEIKPLIAKQKTSKGLEEEYGLIEYLRNNLKKA
jgi:NADH pyrophosphatase NudC (nudix superfamily)